MHVSALHIWSRSRRRALHRLLGAELLKVLANLAWLG